MSLDVDRITNNPTSIRILSSIVRLIARRIGHHIADPAGSDAIEAIYLAGGASISTEEHHVLETSTGGHHANTASIAS